MFALDYHGEGFGSVYSHGNILETEFSFVDYCFNSSKERCWGEYLLPPNERPQPVWWVNIALPDGKTGWTDKADSFGHKDACGG